MRHFVRFSQLVVLGLTVAACGSEVAGPMAEPHRDPRVIDVAAQEIQLQPFTIRMSKLAYVFDVELTDPMFDTLYQQRYALGDHDYARALRPDRRWSSRRIGIWVKALLPVCNSARFNELYPALSANPDGLILRAYGRPADAEDRMVITEALSQSPTGMNDDATVCLALLSSLEFVAQ